MCGRFSLVATERKIQEQIPSLDLSGTSSLRANYNIAPTQHAYVITDEHPTRLNYFTWGLVPFWANDGKNSGKLINARSESIATKPSFRIPIRQKRCLVIADSFYEWRREGGQKLPYRILPKDGKLLVMAGIWDTWAKGNGYPVNSFSIITTTPNEEMKSIHNRMPVLMTEQVQQELWLGKTPLQTVLNMLHPAPDETLKAYRVSMAVNSVHNNGVELHQEVPEDLNLFTQR